jgi:hypothetical protein
MAGCSGITGTGARCRAIAITGSDYCHAHHPGRAALRKRAASKGGKRGGRGRPMAELHSIRDRLEALAEDVLEGRVDRGKAAVAGQLYNTLIRSISVELKAKEQLELEARLEEIEAALEHRGEGYPYGA